MAKYYLAVKPWEPLWGPDDEASHGKGSVVVAVHQRKSDILCSYLCAHRKLKSNNAPAWYFTYDALKEISEEQALDPVWRKWAYAFYSGDSSPLEEISNEKDV